MSRSVFAMITAASLAAAEVLAASVNAEDLRWSRLPSLPDPLGVAGAFAGVSDGALLVGGGANFPDKMLWEGGRKVWHDTVYALSETNGSWRAVGRLPHPLAYGISLTTSAGVLCIGGSDADRHYAEVFLLVQSGGKLRIQSLPSLPVPLANGAGALLNNVAYVASGSDRPGEQAALNRFFALDMAASKPVWQELAPCPGEARILPLAAAAQGAFYLMGGAALRPVEGKVKRAYLRDTWRFVPGGKWERLADMPKPSVAAASPAPVVDSTLLVTGGDDGSLIGFQPPEKHPGFPKALQALDLSTGRWTAFGETPAPRATLPVVEWRGLFVLPSGELRPGVRSAEIWTFHADKPR